MAVDFVSPAFYRIAGGCFRYMAAGLFIATLSLAQAESLFADGVQMALHQGRAHEGSPQHHGEGRGGKGFCPQARTVPQAPDNFVARKNPLSATDQDVNAGETLFQLQAEPTACKICHGANGNGMGLMAQGAGAIPRNFTCAETMKGISDGQLFWVIKNGSGGTGMPAFKFLNDKQIWQLILYLRKFAG